MRVAFSTRENRAMRCTGSLPTLRPLALGETEPGFSVDAAKRVVEGDGASRLIQLQQIEPVRRRPGCRHNALRLSSPPCPMRVVRVAQLQPRDFHGLRGIRNIQDN